MSDGDITPPTITTHTITTELEELNNILADAIRRNDADLNSTIQSITQLKQSTDTAISEAAAKNNKELIELKQQNTDLQTSKSSLEQKLQGLNDISAKVKTIKENVNRLIEKNNTNNEKLKNATQGLNEAGTGGYQYKSKSKKSNSKRMLKLNRFGLLKSRSKSKKSKKKLRPKKHKKGRRKSVKKGGMKCKSSKKNKKKTKKSKKKHTKRK
tara:strand:+ start:349 stop:984 length:636 start_codon:yes stop_codon:yes gene_type:complete